MDILLSYLLVNLASEVPYIDIHNVCLAGITITPDLFQDFFPFDDPVLIRCQEQEKVEFLLCEVDDFIPHPYFVAVRINGKVTDGIGRIYDDFRFLMLHRPSHP